MILASRSPRRSELLGRIGIAPIVRPVDIDETRREDEAPRELVVRLARGKAHACRDGMAGPVNDVVLAADTVVWTDGTVLGKPRNTKDARAMLRSLSGRSHHVSTGVALIAPDGRETSFVETTTVTFHELTEGEIAAYASSGEPRDKAGAYGIQGLGSLLVRGIEGDYDNVVGLPLARVVRELDRLCPTAPTLCETALTGGRHA